MIKKFKVLFYCLIILIFTNISFGIILYPEGEPDSSWSNRPPDSVIVKFSPLCSGVVIHPQYVLTASHCNVNYLSTLLVDGHQYQPELIYNNTFHDLTLIKVADANFVDFIEVIDNDDLGNEIITFGGYGKTRGNTIYATYDPNLVIGYQWGENYGHLLWGTNKISGYNNFALYTRFDELDNTPYEAGLSLYDSGCGAFCFIDGEWKVIGIGTSVDDYGYDYFLSPTFPDLTFLGTKNTFLRLYILNRWIESIIYSADINKDNNVDIIDLISFSTEWLIEPPSNFPPFYYQVYSIRSDLNHDGKVNLVDFTIFQEEWQK